MELFLYGAAITYACCYAPQKEWKNNNDIANNANNKKNYGIKKYGPRQIRWVGNKNDQNTLKLHKNSAIDNDANTTDLFIGSQIQNPIQEASYERTIKSMKNAIKIAEREKDKKSVKIALACQLLLDIAQNTFNKLTDSRKGSISLDYHNNISYEEYYNAVEKLEQYINQAPNKESNITEKPNQKPTSLKHEYRPNNKKNSSSQAI